MSLLLKNALLVDPEAGTETLGDLRVENGLIADPDGPAAQVIDCGGKALAPGIIDMNVFIGEPGFRHRESYRTGGLAAAAGGVTTIIAQPMTDPVIDDPAVVESIRRRADEICPVNVRVMGALTGGLEGKTMSEMGFLQDAGAVAFTDGPTPVANPVVFRRCLSYAASIGALVVHHPQEPTLSKAGCATEGFFATKLGLPGVPPAAERIMLERDLALVEITGARYHADQVSTAEGVERIRAAKARGLKVSASASIHHLTLNEFDIGEWRTFFKFDPPLRSEDDRMALVEGVAEGVIDVITSAHMPQDEETKRVPFEIAARGAIGLETLLSAAMQLRAAGALDLAALFARLSLAPARLLGLPGGRLSVGAPADLVLFDPNAPFVMDRFGLESRSKNTPYDGRRMEGRVLRTFVAGREVYAREGAPA
ncbi:dihydroorotase [Rhodovulum sp. DZ06]|uniref:dihydroorotase n=1 Tax=Rhodovulum sp. DZ06 TaxID=3425126 RepID=UPI003D32A12D